jgi:hypothetical protein
VNGFSTGQNATACTAWATCGAGTRVLAAGTPTSNRTCAGCTTGFSVAENAPSCTPFRTCPSGYEVAEEGTPTSDVECADIDECEDEQDNPCVAGGDEGAECSDTDGSYSCTCSTGFLARDNACLPPFNCTHLLINAPGLASGDYAIDPDGAGGIAPFIASCDLTTDGGGWTLVLNYARQTDTSPALDVRAIDLPLLGSDVLGDDGSGTASWGHAGNALMAELISSELYFHAESSRHARVIDFITDDLTCIEYFESGDSSEGCEGVATSFRALAGHTAFLPGSTASVVVDAGDLAMVELPFYEPLYRWHVGGASDTWAADDTDDDGSGSTLHRIWSREAFPIDCADLHALDPSAPSGDYTLDGDGLGGLAPTVVTCDMD